MTMFNIELFDSAYHQWARQFIPAHLGSTLMVSRGVLYDTVDMPGFVALVDGQPQGIISYHIENRECEIRLLISGVEGLGIGSALVERVKQVAQEQACTRLWLITTNDNIHAIRWYQKRGFTIAAVYVNALAQSRQLKPEIPLIGNDGIPLRDEFEFEIKFA